VSYLNKYKTEVIESGKKKMLGFYGAGGSQKKRSVRSTQNQPYTGQQNCNCG